MKELSAFLAVEWCSKNLIGTVFIYTPLTNKQPDLQSLEAIQALSFLLYSSPQLMVYIYTFSVYLRHDCYLIDTFSLLKYCEIYFGTISSPISCKDTGVLACRCTSAYYIV